MSWTGGGGDARDVRWSQMIQYSRRTHFGNATDSTRPNKAGGEMNFVNVGDVKMTVTEAARLIYSATIATDKLVPE